MKKITLYLAAAAAAVLTIVSCNKNEIAAPESGPKARITIGAKPKETVDVSKTFLSETASPTGGSTYTVKWSNSGEQLGALFGETTKSPTLVTLSADDTQNNDPVFYGEGSLKDSTYNLFLFYPKAAYEKCYSDGTVGFNLKASQHPVLGSFDPACDLMGWATDNATVTGGSYVLENITLQRVMAILRINLNADEGAKAKGEVVTGFKMEVPAGEGEGQVVLTGRAAINNQGEIVKWNIANNYAEASVDAAELVTIGEGDGFNALYLIVNPTTIPTGRTINFSIETETYNGVNKITRSVTVPADMQLEAGNVNIINLKVRDKDVPGTIVDEDYNGDWLITGVKNEVTYAAVAYASGNNIKATAPLTFSADGSSISSTADLSQSLMTFTEVTEGDYAGMYTIQDANGKYLYAASSSANQLKAKDEPDENAYWTVTMDGDDYSIIATKSENRKVMQFNPNGTSDAIIACYASASQTPVKLYPASMISGLTTDPVITFAGEKDGIVEKEVSASTTSVEFTYTKNKYVTDLPTATKVAGLDLFEGDPVVTDGKVTIAIKPNTDAQQKTISVKMTGQGIAEGGVYLEIIQAAYESAAVLTIKSLNDQIRTDNVTSSGSAKEYSGNIQDVIITGVKGNYTFAEDATGGILIYQVSGLQAGKTYSGETTIKGYMYSKMPEVTSFPTTGLTVGTASTIPSTTYTSIADLTAVWDAKMSMRSVLQNVTVKTAFSNYNATVEDASGNTLTVRDYAKSNLTLTVGDQVTITGYPAQYNTTKQFAVLDAADITVSSNPDSPTLSVSATSLIWEANEYGESSAKQVTVTLNSGVDEDNYNIDGSSTDWVVTPYSGSANVVSVYPKAANTGSAAKTFTFKVVHGDDATVYKEITCSQAMSAPVTIADILAGGANTYAGTTDELLVYAVSGSNAIVGDSSGKMLLYKSGMTVGNKISISNATVIDYNNTGVLEINGGTFTTNSTGNAVDHGSAVDLDDATVASSTLSSFSASGYHPAVFIKMTGTQSGRNITGANAVLYLNLANTTFDGKSVAVTGYIYCYSSSHSNYNFQLVSIEENTDPNTPTLSVSPTSLSWGATDSGQSSAKTVTVTLNAGVDEDNYNIEGSSTDWVVTPYSGNANVVSVYPTAANTGSTAKTFTFKVVHGDDATVYEEITCTQAAASTGGTSTATLTGDNMAAMSNAGSSYGTTKSVTVGSFTWSTNGYQTSTLKNMIQLRKRDHSSGVSYLALPTFPGNIQSITMEVTNSSSGSLSDGTNPDATIGFQAGTTSSESLIVSGKAANKTITLDLSSKACKTGYIVAEVYAYRIWSVTVVYNNN